MPSDTREAKRRWYHRNKERVKRQQAAYQARRRQDPAIAARRRRDTKRWEYRFAEAMASTGAPGRGGGLTAAGYRYRERRGLAVPPWPTLLAPAKGRRHRAAKI